jgi:hypothetical protein
VNGTARLGHLLPVHGESMSERVLVKNLKKTSGTATRGKK